MEVVSTSGELFASGEMLEIVRPGGRGAPLQLLHWDGKAATVAASVEVGGKTYKPPEIAPSLLRVLRLPSGLSRFDSASTLVSELDVQVQIYSGLPERYSRLVSIYAAMTWLCDQLPNAPRLVLLGPSGRGTRQLSFRAAGP